MKNAIVVDYKVGDIRYSCTVKINPKWHDYCIEVSIVEEIAKILDPENVSPGLICRKTKNGLALLPDNAVLAAIGVELNWSKFWRDFDQKFQGVVPA